MKKLAMCILAAATAVAMPMAAMAAAAGGSGGGAPASSQSSGGSLFGSLLGQPQPSTLGEVPSACSGGNYWVKPTSTTYAPSVCYNAVNALDALNLPGDTSYPSMVVSTYVAANTSCWTSPSFTGQTTAFYFPDSNTCSISAGGSTSNNQMVFTTTTTYNGQPVYNALTMNTACLSNPLLDQMDSVTVKTATAPSIVNGVFVPGTMKISAPYTCS